MMSSSENDQTNHGQSGEPSMEEILASIRRILKDENGQPVASPAIGGTPAESTLAKSTPVNEALAMPAPAHPYEPEPLHEAPAPPLHSLADEDDDVFVLDSAMIAKPVDLTSATVSPAAAHEEHEPYDYAGDDLSDETIIGVPLPEPRYEEQPTAPTAPAAPLPSWPPAQPFNDPGFDRPGPAAAPATPVFGQKMPSGLPAFTPPPGFTPPPLPEAPAAFTPSPVPPPLSFEPETPPETLAEPPAETPTPSVFTSRFAPDLARPAPPPHFEPMPLQATPVSNVPGTNQDAGPTQQTAPQPEIYMPEPTNNNSYQAPENIISESASAAAASSIGAMVRSITAERSVAVSRAGATIEDMVREELRPLLKAWMDTHLPTLVERVVRVEIEKVVNRTLT